jgi:stress response protein SCP2
MSLSLVKDQVLDLNKETGKVLTKLRLGAGWDMADGVAAFDLDLILIPKGQQPCFFGKMEIAGAKLDKDDRKGDSSKDGADENIAIDVAGLTAEEYTVAIVIYEAVKKGQFLKDVKRAFVEIEDTETKTKIFTYDITAHGGDNSALIAGKLVKKNGGLEFTALEQLSNKDLSAIITENGGTL